MSKKGTQEEVSSTNKDILYEGPKKSVKERWEAAYEWMKEKRENKSK